MDFVKNLAGGDKNENNTNQTGATQNQSSSEGGFMDKINGAMGGGKSSEAKEDYLDKAVDYVQEKAFGQGDQSNESAVEQIKDEQISDAIRRAYKNSTGSEFPVADKE